MATIHIRWLFAVPRLNARTPLFVLELVFIRSLLATYELRERNVIHSFFNTSKERLELVIYVIVSNSWEQEH